MTTYRYSTEAAANEAKAVGVALPISYKQSYEVAKALRGKTLQKAKRFLEEVIAMKRPVPMTRFNADTGHKHGIAAGRYAVNTCTHILKLIKGAEANAQFKGLSTANLVVRHIAAQHGPTSYRYGRHRRIQAKRAHLEVVLKEVKQQASEQKKSRVAKPAAPKAHETAKTPAQKPQSAKSQSHEATK